MLYALFEKFGDDISKKRFKEMIEMTEIGKMILDEGIMQGEIKGKAKGKAELLIIQLTKKFKKVPEEYIKKIKNFSETTIEVIATEIFDLERIEDIERYL